MAFAYKLFLICFLFSTVIVSPSLAQTSFRPKALVLPVSKDPSTLQHITQINQRTPLVPVKLTLDLGGQHLWVDCEEGFASSSFRNVRCNSAQCSLAGSGICIGSDGPRICGLYNDNTVASGASSDGEVGQDVVSVQSTNGSNPGRTVSVSNFIFSCAPTSNLKGLPNGVKGMAGLGRRTRISLPYQFSAAFSFDRKFAICLSSSTNAQGVAFFGNGPYVLRPNTDVSKSLTFTPLLINPVSTASGYLLGESSAEYFIGVKSIKVNEKTVPLNVSLLSIDEQGYGGTKLSTVDPYTVMETTIYNAVVDAFVKELELSNNNIHRVASVSPFGVCFNSTGISSTRLGPSVPSIDLVLQNNNVYWRISGANSMVQVKEDGVLCLGIVDGGANPRTSIVIGGHQLEDNLLQFDLAASRLGFSSSLLSRQTTCANFDFTAVA